MGELLGGSVLGALAAVALGAIALGEGSGCVRHAVAPEETSHDARFGFAPDDFDAPRACGDWLEATDGHVDAQVHTAFPENVWSGCFVRVHYDQSPISAEPVPVGCGYPDDAAARTLAARAAGYRRSASSASPAPADRSREAGAGLAAGRLPLELACELPADVRAAAARVNERSLESFGQARAAGRDERLYPYALVGAFGYGNAAQASIAISRWRPGDACAPLAGVDRAALGVNLVRAKRAAEAFHAGVAPFVSLSGGAVHSPAYEAFMLMELVTCELGVPADRVLLDPCADHTHTNVRNTGALVEHVGGRFAYLVTDDGLQSDYLEEWTFFDVLLGSIDQRALRDFGYLLGSWRRASVGMRAGYWFTPYRFWAESPDDLGSFSCVGDVAR
jgi:hypothetical protein